jgi:uncharacterized protein YuzB (UPF0349 family)
MKLPLLVLAAGITHTVATNDIVCEALKGGSPGLYGLCTAFCKNHDNDYSSLSALDQADAIAQDTPSARILANYNKKMKAGDPTMPCLVPDVVPDSCPCWQPADLDNILGFAGENQFRDTFPALANTQLVHTNTNKPVLSLNSDPRRGTLCYGYELINGEVVSASSIDQLQFDDCLASYESFMLTNGAVTEGDTNNKQYSLTYTN